MTLTKFNTKKIQQLSNLDIQVVSSLLCTISNFPWEWFYWRDFFYTHEPKLGLATETWLPLPVVSTNEEIIPCPRAAPTVSRKSALAVACHWDPYEYMGKWREDISYYSTTTLPIFFLFVQSTSKISTIYWPAGFPKGNKHFYFALREYLWHQKKKKNF